MGTASADDRVAWRPPAPDPVRPRPAQMVLAITVGFAFLWAGKLVLLTLIVSGMLAFILDPLVVLATRARLPRPVGAFLVVAAALSAVIGLGLLFSAKAVDFAQDLPRYSGHLKKSLERLDAQRQRLQETTEAVLPDSAKDSATKTVRVQDSRGWGAGIMKGLGSAMEVLLVTSFIPFLVYFMLSWARHLRLATVGLFAAAERPHADAVLGEIAAMIRAFMAGNFFIGVVLSLLSIGVFAVLELPNFYFVGPLSGFLSVVPYLGVVLAVAPPLIVGVEDMSVARALAIVTTVLGLHLLALNVLYPKLIGKRLDLNPVSVTVALLVWGWLWGAMGLVVAVPLVGALKIVCDHVEGAKPWGRLLGE